MAAAQFRALLVMIRALYAAGNDIAISHTHPEKILEETIKRTAQSHGVN